MAPIYALHDSGDYAGTVDAFLTMAIGPGYRPSLDETLSPDWFAQSVADLDTLFLVEGPAYREWQFTEELARSISQPAFVVVGAESPQVRVEDHALLQTWLPQADAFVLQGASH
ncbi:MAG: alpha/beta fold hydrolase, partial [Acidobacteriota bacterium]